MYPDWLTDGVALPTGSLGELLGTARAMVPAGLLADSELDDDVAQAARFGYHHLWLDGLHRIGWFAQEAGRDEELPAAFWARLAAAAHQMDFPEFVPFCLGKARRLPRQDFDDQNAAFATLPVGFGPAWRQENDVLTSLCEQVADAVRAAVPDAAPLLAAGEVRPLRARLADAGADGEIGGTVERLLYAGFELAFAVVTGVDLPAGKREHAWALIATNRFFVQVTGWQPPASSATVWWRY